MYYFRVKHDADQTPVLDNHGFVKRHLIAEELYTRREFTKLIKSSRNKHELESCVIGVKHPKSKVYWMFGARFADHTFISKREG